MDPKAFFFRQGGVVGEAIWPVPPLQALGFAVANAYAKAGRGEPLAEDDRAALSQARELGDKGPGFVGAADARRGYLIKEHPELVRRLDALALEMAEALAVTQFSAPVREDFAWEAITTYAAAARQAVREERGLFGPESQPTGSPDGGPEGWSNVPPLNADGSEDLQHPQHPASPSNANATPQGFEGAPFHSVEINGDFTLTAFTSPLAASTDPYSVLLSLVDPDELAKAGGDLLKLPNAEAVKAAMAAIVRAAVTAARADPWGNAGQLAADAFGAFRGLNPGPSKDGEK